MAASATGAGGRHAEKELGGLRNWARARAPGILPLGACACSDECTQVLMVERGYPTYQICHDPQRADILLVAGRVSHKMAAAIKDARLLMQPAAKVVAWGACACSGGLCATYATVALEDVVAVDAHVPGCPPRPEDLAEALRLVFGRRNHL